MWSCLQPTIDPLTAFLMTEGRQVYAVAGDGNCMFRSLSHQLYGTSERHFSVRALLLRFENKNQEIFSKLLMEVNSPTIQSHIKKLNLPGKWGTHVELHAAATYFQIPVFFIRTPCNNYKWEVINPLGPASDFKYQLCPEVDITEADVNVPDHFELLYTSDCHYDSITMVTGSVCPVKPTLQGSYCDCTDTLIE